MHRRDARVRLALACACAGLSLGAERLAAQGTSDPALLEGAAVPGALVITHCGVGSRPEVGDGAQRAAEDALAVLRGDGSALDAAIVGTQAMEDDPRYNAGTGANIRLDGRTIQMDAALMTDRGRFAAVAVIERVRNPIRVVEKVLETPHLFLAGEGATRFAHLAGFEDHVPTCPEAEAKFRKRLRDVARALGRADSDEFDWRAYWNFPGPMPEALRALQEHGDTVGTVVRTADGRFAATISTGGTSVTLYGRVGDVPVYGAGIYAGPAGAIACTGHGEQIIRHAMARRVYENLADGTTVLDAVRVALEEFPHTSSLGLIAVDRDGWAVGANREMAYGFAHHP